MMNDRELANEVVALGVGNSWGDSFAIDEKVQLDPVEIIEDGPVPLELFVRDWRVAGALMEKLSFIELSHHSTDGWKATTFEGTEPDSVYNESLPRAIIEAYVVADRR